METNFKNRETQQRNIKSQQRNKIHKKEPNGNFKPKNIIT